MTEPNDDAYSIAVMIRDRAAELDDTPVFTFEGKTTSYQQLHENSNRLARGLLSLNLQHGDRVAYLGKNSPFYFELIAAAAITGIVVTSVNWRLARPEIEYVLSDSQA